LRSSRGESTTSEIGFYPGHLEERLTGRTQQTTGLMVKYEVVKVSRLLSRKLFPRLKQISVIWQRGSDMAKSAEVVVR